MTVGLPRADFAYRVANNLNSSRRTSVVRYDAVFRVPRGRISKAADHVKPKCTPFCHLPLSGTEIARAGVGQQLPLWLRSEIPAIDGTR